MRPRLTVLLSAFLLAVAALLAPVGSAWAICAPTTSGIFPASGSVGTAVPATVLGSGLAGATASVFGDAGLTATVQTTSDTSVSLNLVIDAAAAPGERIITLTTPAGAVAVNFTVNAVGGPVVTGVTPAMTATQGFALDVQIAGQNLAGLLPENVTISGYGVTLTSANALGDGTRLDVSLAVAADADLGTHALVIAGPTGGAVLQLYVQRPAPVITDVTPAAGEVGTTFTMTITGANLTGAALIITSGAGGAGGVTFSNTSSPDDNTLTTTVTVSGALSAETEARLLIVTTESGQVTAQFFVVAPNVPSLTSIRPGAGSPGQTVPVTLRGLNLTNAVVTTLSASLTLQNGVVVDDETITLDVVISDLAATNTNHTITATVPLVGSANITFRVIPTDSPFIGAVIPPFGNRGSTVALILDGVNLGTVVPGTGVDISSSGITESNATALDSQTVRAIISININANAGIRDVDVITSAGTYRKNASFRVNIPGQVPTITDVVPTVVQPGTTTSITVTGSGFEGGGVTVGGPGVTVTNVVVDPSFTSLTFDLTLAADAPAENRPLIVVTENGSATCGILSLGATIDLRSAKIVKTGASFEALTTGFRLFVFEFSINDRFDLGVRTYSVSSLTSSIVLSRLDVENVGRAVRDLPFAYVRVRGVTATNQVGTSNPARLRR